MLYVKLLLGLAFILAIGRLFKKPSKTVSTEQAFEDLNRSAILHDSRSAYCRQIGCKAKNGGRQHPQCCKSSASPN